MHRAKRTGLLFAGLLACALVAGAGQVSAFDANKLYQYDFQGTITSRLAEDERPQYAGVSLSSSILVDKSSDSNELTVKLDGLKMATFNDVIEDLDQYANYDYKPVEEGSPLHKAFKIYFEDGSVKAFDTYKDEPKWVTNFKRGLLSFFQLKLKQADDSSSSSSSGANTGDNKPTEPSQYYTSAEKSVFGECETDYLVMSGTNEVASGGDQSASVPFMNVTKTRNMAKCKTRFLHRFMPIDASECYENEKDLQQYKHSNAIFNFHLTGSPQNYVIKEVQLDELTTFSPFGQKAHSHLVQNKFSMKLNKIGDQRRLDTESGATRIDSLSYDPPEMLNFYANINLDEEHHLSTIYQTSASVDQVMSAFDALVQEHKTYTGAFEGQAPNGQTNYQETSRLAEFFVRLNELVGTMNSQKIEQLYSQVDERGEGHKKIFWDLMSVVGTNPSFMFMKKLITDGDAPSVKIKDFLTRLSYHIKMPSKSLFDEYVNLCKSDKIQTNQQYKRLCSLPLASLIHQHCAKPHAKYLRLQQEGANATAYKKAQNTCQIATAEEYFSRLVAPTGSSGSSGGSGGASGSGGSSSSGSDSELSIGDKMFNIKMAGELGVKPSIDFLMETIRNRDEHPSLRAAAMWNLNKVSHIYPAQVKRLVVPYYYDQGELLEVRLAAFYNWLYSGLSLYEMETMVKQLAQEPSRQLVLYIHSAIKSLAELSPFPCTHSNEKNARLVLPALESALKNHAPASMSDSRASMSSSWQPEFGFGTATMMSVIMSNESVAPTNLFYSTSEIMSGLKLSPMSISIQAHGLDKLIKRVVGINGLLSDKESFMDVFSLKRRSKRQANQGATGAAAAEQLIKQEAMEIDKELKLATRDFSDVYLAVTISAYGRPITFFDRDSRELKKMLSEDGTIKIPQIKKLLHSFNNHTTQQMMISFEKLEVFNNELGLPLYQSICDFDYKTFKLNSVKLDIEPGFFKDERQGKPPTKLAASLDAKMGRHNEMFVSTGALLVNTKQKAGVGFYKKKLVNIPLKVSVEANLVDNKISLKRQPIHENLLYIKQYPVTYVHSYEPEGSTVNGAPNRNRSSWLPHYDMSNVAQMKPFKLDYMTPLALGLKVEGKHRVGQDWSFAAWRRYLNSVGLQAAKFMYFYSPTGAPMEVRLSTVTTEENPTKELTEVFSWKHHHHEHEETGGEHPANELNEIEKELEAFVSARGQSIAGGRPTTVSYKLALLGGSTKERKVSLDLSYSRSFDRLAHKWRAFYQRTPLDQSSTSAQSEVTNLCWIGQLQYPKLNIERLLKFDLLSQDRQAQMSNHLTFGDECTEGKLDSAPSKVDMRVKFDWSQEQREMIEEALRGADDKSSGDEQAASGSGSGSGRKNTLKRMAKRCNMKRASTGATLDPICLEVLRKMTELTHISAAIDYKDVPERWTKLMGKVGSLYTYARAGYIDEIDDRPASSYRSASGGDDGKQQQTAQLEANMTGCSRDRKLSYEFNTPSYHVVYKNLPVSVPPLSVFPLLDASYYKTLQGRGAGSRVCSVSGQQVTTFDNLTYTMPAVGDGCFKLITKDCSPENNFVVLGAKAGSGKVVKVYVAQKFKVEFVPDKDGKRISDIKVNGETVSVEADKVPLRRDTKLGAKTHEAFTIENNGAYYTLNSKLYKFSVSTDGTWIFVQQSKYYAGKSCGICGDANGDQLLELKSPTSSRRLCKNTNSFVWSYVLPSTCASRPTNIECA